MMQVLFMEPPTIKTRKKNKANKSLDFIKEEIVILLIILSLRTAHLKVAPSVQRMGVLEVLLVKKFQIHNQ
jgi:hypothetical protein